MTKKVLIWALVGIFILSSLVGCSAVNNAQQKGAVDMPITGGPAPGGASPAAGGPPPSPAGAPSNSSVKDQYGQSLSSASNSTAYTPGAEVMDKQSFGNAILAQRKVIRNANVTIEVEDFEVAYGKIKSMISAFGYVQETNIRTEKVHINSKEKLLKRGIVIVRIDKQKFDDVLSGIKGIGLLTNESIKSDDVTEQFFDSESRLKLLRYEEERLNQYLQKITDPEVIFKTESRLTSIRHEIESLTGTLNKWNDLVALSTITINMNEKGDPLGITGNSYWGRLTSGFLGNLKGVGTFFGEFLLLLISALPILVVLIFLGLGAFFGVRKVKEKKNKPAVHIIEEENKKA